MRPGRSLFGALVGLCGAVAAANAGAVSAGAATGDAVVSRYVAPTGTAATHLVPGGAVQVFPSGATVPQNLLRISLQFDHPMRAGTLTRLHLIHCGGAPIQAAFLEQELWSPDAQRLTVLMHPGRVKTRLRAHRELGTALSVGGCVALIFGDRRIKTWQVVPSVTLPLQPRLWQIDAPKPGSRAPLIVRLNRALDQQSASLIAVQSPDGARLEGEGTLDPGETVWRFEPAAAWRVGGYALRCHPALEDPEGNRIGDPFEHRAVAARHASFGNGTAAGYAIKFNVE